MVAWRNGGIRSSNIIDRRPIQNRIPQVGALHRSFGGAAQFAQRRFGQIGATASRLPMMAQGTVGSMTSRQMPVMQRIEQANNDFNRNNVKMVTGAYNAVRDFGADVFRGFGRRSNPNGPVMGSRESLNIGSIFGMRKAQTRGRRLTVTYEDMQRFQTVGGTMPVFFPQGDRSPADRVHDMIQNEIRRVPRSGRLTTQERVVDEIGGAMRIRTDRFLKKW